MVVSSVIAVSMLAGLAEMGRRPGPRPTAPTLRGRHSCTTSTCSSSTCCPSSARLSFGRSRRRRSLAGRPTGLPPAMAESQSVTHSIFSARSCSVLWRAGRSRRTRTRAVRKAPRPRHAEVRPLPPATIERMRAASTPRDATLISVLAYAGVRPGEALALQWRDIREQTILVERAVSLGEEKDTKTAAHRTVRLLQPLAADLRGWRLRSGRPSGKTLVFPSAAGTVWSQPAYQSWRRRAFKRALDGASRGTRATVRPAALVCVAPAPRGPLGDLRRPAARP